MDLFRDESEVLRFARDRSAEVASKVLFAAIVEFADGVTSPTVTHRSLAQATLKGAGNFFGKSAEMNWISRTKVMIDAAAMVVAGYCVNRLADRELFQGIGFHIGSEILADEEFRILDRLLEVRYPDLVAYLGGIEVTIGNFQLPGYYWVKEHIGLEAGHFAAAAAGANDAIRYYAGQEDEKTLKTWILDGFKKFTAVQSAFMEGLREQ